MQLNPMIPEKSNKTSVREMLKVLRTMGSIHNQTPADNPGRTAEEAYAQMERAKKLYATRRIDNE